MLIFLLCSLVTVIMLLLYTALDKVYQQMKQLNEHHERIDYVLKCYREDQKLLRECFEAMEDTLADMSKPTPPTPPIKPNNWDSVRSAFTGPVRAEVNERN